MRARSATPSPTPRSRLTRSTSCRLGAARDRPGPPRRMERPRALAHPDRPLGQGHPLVAAQGARTPDDRPARHARRGPAAPTARSTAPSCCAKSCGCSTTSTTRALAPAHLDAWLAWATRSRLKPFVRLARTLRRHRDGILAAIRLGLSNGRLEGLNSKIRLISHRSFGFHSADALIALVYLCCTGIVIDLPR